MDTVDIYELVARFGATKIQDTGKTQQLSDIFTFLEDGTDSALKILIPLILAYSDLDNQYGRESEKVVQISISENNRLKIAINCPILINEIIPGMNSGLFSPSGNHLFIGNNL